MTVLPFRKPNATAPAPRPSKPRAIAEQVNAQPESVAGLDLSQVIRIEGTGEDGSPFITYPKITAREAPSFKAGSELRL